MTTSITRRTTHPGYTENVQRLIAMTTEQVELSVAKESKYGTYHFMGVSLMKRADAADYLTSQYYIGVLGLVVNEKFPAGFVVSDHVGAAWLDVDEHFVLAGALEQWVLDEARNLSGTPRRPHNDVWAMTGDTIPDFLLTSTSLLPHEWKQWLNGYFAKPRDERTFDDVVAAGDITHAVQLYVDHFLWTERRRMLAGTDKAYTYRIG